MDIQTEETVHDFLQYNSRGIRLQVAKAQNKINTQNIDKPQNSKLTFQRLVEDGHYLQGM
jgi:hypothetical protein